MKQSVSQLINQLINQSSFTAERLLSTLHHYEMVVPTMVNPKGEFISYRLHQPQDGESGIRKKRWATSGYYENDVTNDLPQQPVDAVHTDESDGRIYYRLSAYGREFRFNLTLNSLLVSEDFIVEHWSKAGVERHHHSVPACHYVGHSQSPTASRAAISNCNGLVSILSLLSLFTFLHLLPLSVNTFQRCYVAQ